MHVYNQLKRDLIAQLYKWYINRHSLKSAYLVFYSGHFIQMESYNGPSVFGILIHSQGSFMLQCAVLMPV
jgi:hypothetical protein